MKIMIQAIRAVSVELVGVVLVCWLLIHVASWGLRTTIGFETQRNVNRAALQTHRDFAQAFPTAQGATVVALDNGSDRLGVATRLSADYSTSALHPFQSVQFARMR